MAKQQQAPRTTGTQCNCAMGAGQGVSSADDDGAHVSDGAVEQSHKSEHEGKTSTEEQDGRLLESFGLQGWLDVTYRLIPESKVLKLGAPARFTHIFSLLYKMEVKNELSMRALELTMEALKLNSSNPTTWMYRHRIIDALSADNPAILKQELSLTASILKNSRKNYQAWEHRRYLVEKTGALQTEAEFVDVILQLDTKNYHAWAHRAWLVKKGVLDGEMEACEWYINSDVRNNSAWNHRWLVSGLSGREGEVSFACEIAVKAPRNESVWNYILALARSDFDVTQAHRLANHCLANDGGCTPARRFLVLTAGARDAQAVAEHCRLLAHGVDPIRTKYWLMQLQAAVHIVQNSSVDPAADDDDIS